MAYHRFITIDGRRVDFDAAKIDGEHSCDECGEFLPDQGRAFGSVTVTIQDRGQATQAVDAHPEHLVAALAKALNRVINQLYS